MSGDDLEIAVEVMHVTRWPGVEVFRLQSLGVRWVPWDGGAIPTRDPEDPDVLWATPRVAEVPNSIRRRSNAQKP